MWESICLTLAATAGNNIGKVLQKKGTVILPPLSFKLKVRFPWFGSLIPLSFSFLLWFSGLCHLHLGVFLFPVLDMWVFLIPGFCDFMGVWCLYFVGSDQLILGFLFFFLKVYGSLVLVFCGFWGFKSNDSWVSFSLKISWVWTVLLSLLLSSLGF